MTMMQHRESTGFRIVDRYEADSLGAPFKVVLTRSVCVGIDKETGNTRVQIPDLKGLISAVIRLRVTDPVKLAGPDIRFLRRALDLRANKLAAFLDVSAEHYSRWEAGDRVMSSSAERLFRLFAFGATWTKEPSRLLEIPRDSPFVGEPKEKSKEPAKKFFEFFFNMKIDPVRSANEEIEYVLCRSPQPSECFDHSKDDEGDWQAAQLNDAA
jgi:transcriptional regulator with XRE-family HTH domain